MKINFKIACRSFVAVAILFLCLAPERAHAQLGSRVVVGYFQNWNLSSSPYIRLRDVNSKYNVINVAFATPVSTSDMTMTFAPAVQTQAEFISDIKTLQAQGRKVQISIGGADAPVQLQTTADRDKFVSSMKTIISTYGFDGFDIDLEGNSVILDNGDVNFKSPTTPKINNLISAARQLVTYFRGLGKDFWLTSAPETQYVQGGYGNYGTAFGGYLPVLYSLRDILTFVHVQYYNTGSQFGLDDKIYSQSTADFIVSMTDMLLRGFPVARNTSNVFPALREDQVAFGLPATNTGAAPSGGYVAPAELNKALNYLVKGISYGSAYVTPKSYPGLRGIMTWSINWDKTTGDAWVTNAYNFFSGLGGNVPPSVSITSPANNATFATGSNITINASASDGNGSVSKVDFYNGTTLLGTDTSNPYSFTWNAVGAGTYSLTAKATDNQGAVGTSSVVTITVNNANNPAPTTSITSPANGAIFTAPASITITANAADTAPGTVSKVDFYNGTTLLGTDTSSPYSFTWSNVVAGSYALTTKATDNQGAVGTSSMVTITVNNANNPAPTTSITSPANGATFTAPASITINATATDNVSVSKVDFYNGTTLLGTDTSSPYSFSWTNVAAGSYTLTTKATDNQGAVGTSAAITITVSGSTGTCTGKPTYVENSGYIAGSQVQNVGNLYECKPYPYSGWCNGAAWAYAPGSGTYWTDAWILKGSCSSSSARIAQDEADTFSEVKGMLVSPNPGVSGRPHTVTITFESDAGNVNVSLYNMSGMNIMNSTHDNVKRTLNVDMPALSSGLHIMRVQHADKVLTTKYMVE